MHPGFVPKNHPNQQKKQGADDSVDDRETPRDVYNPLHAEFGFTIDVAAARHNAKCARYYARAPWTPQEAKQATLFPRTFVGDAEALGFDGLAQPWAAHEVVWCNPPFSDVAAWVEKAHRAECTVVMLLPANRTEQPWWQRYIEPYRDGHARDPYWRQIIRTAFDSDRPRGELETRFVDGRRSFLIQDEVIGNTTSKNPPFGIVLVIWDRRLLSRATRTYRRLRAAMESSP